MEWTTDRPTKDGYYWFQQAYSKPQIVEVFFMIPGVASVEMHGKYFSLKDTNGRWWPETLVAPELPEKR